MPGVIGVLCNLGYYEVPTYSSFMFTDSSLQRSVRLVIVGEVTFFAIDLVDYTIA